MPPKKFGLNFLALYFFDGDGSILPGSTAPGPRGQKSVVGDWGEDGNILVVVDPATGTKTK